MTGKEAINLLKQVNHILVNDDDCWTENTHEPLNTAFSMEIKALEQEPRSAIAKNDLAVREFEEIVVEYLPEDLCTYPEYKGKPYFSIKYKKGNEHFIGYGTYKPEVFQDI